MWAAWKNQAGVVELLIASSAKLDRQDKWGRTALIFAADEGHVGVVGALHCRSVMQQSSDYSFAGSSAPARRCQS